MSNGILTPDSELSWSGRKLKRVAKLQIVAGPVLGLIGIVLFFSGVVGETVIRYLLGCAIFTFSALGVYPVRSEGLLDQSRVFSILVAFYGLYHVYMGFQGVSI